MKQYIELLSALIVILSAIMLVYNWRLNRNILYLSLYLCFFAIEMAISKLVFFGGDLHLYTILSNHFTPLYTLRAPMLFFFVRGMVQDDHRLRVKDLWHVAPFLLHVLMIIPYLFIPFSEKLIIHEQLMRNHQFYLEYNFEYFYPHYWNHYFRSAQMVFYLLISFRLIFRFHDSHREVFNSIPNIYKVNYRWLIVFLTTISLFAFLHVLVQLEFFVLVGMGSVDEQRHTLLSIGLYLYLIVPLMMIAYPNLLYGFPRLSSYVEQFAAIDMSENTATDDVSLLNESGFELTVSKSSEMPTHRSANVDLVALGKLIETHMEKDKPFLDKKFQIHNLSLALNVPMHHIRVCFTENFRTDFTEYKNRFRVQHAINLLLQQHDDLSIEGVGASSGFASNSNFYAAFKSVTGMTPRVWYDNNINAQLIS